MEAETASQLQYRVETASQLQRILTALLPEEAVQESSGRPRKRRTTHQAVMDSYLIRPETAVADAEVCDADSLSLLFCEWYIRQGFMTKTDFAKKARIMSYMKSFLPVGTSIPKPPADTSPSYPDWRRNIMRLAVTAEQELISFLTASRVGGRNIQGNKWRNCQDQFREIDKTKLRSLSCNHVNDAITPAPVLLKYNDISDDDIFQRNKRKRVN